MAFLGTAFIATQQYNDPNTSDAQAGSDTAFNVAAWYTGVPYQSTNLGAIGHSEYSPYTVTPPTYTWG